MEGRVELNGEGKISHPSDIRPGREFTVKSDSSESTTKVIASAEKQHRSDSGL